MPVHKNSDGSYQYGNQKKYHGKDAAKKAHQQAAAIRASGYKDKTSASNQGGGSIGSVGGAG